MKKVNCERAGSFFDIELLFKSENFTDANLLLKNVLKV
jgi:hypothetical protein